MFQFFVVHILRENNYHVICNNYESRKTPFEQYQSIHLGNERGIPDIYTTECLKSVKGAYFELKSDIDKVYTKKLILRNNNHIVEQKVDFKSFHKKLDNIV